MTFGVAKLGMGGAGGALTYATWDPANKSAAITLSNGDLTASEDTVAGAYQSVISTLWKSSGKHYFEVTVDNLGAGAILFGVTTALPSDNQFIGYHISPYNEGFGWQTYSVGGNAGTIYKGSAGFTLGYHNPLGNQVGTPFTVGFDVDFDAGTVAVRSTADARSTPISDARLQSGTWYIGASLYNNGSIVATPIVLNSGQSAFSLTPTAGYNEGWYE